jgi:predicted DNA-binding protein YlxM (UPF0122 family)
MAKNFEIVELIDLYGAVLSPRQQDFLEYYYCHDLSLSEIAENEGMSRQGVRDAIKRAESQLLDAEEKLGLSKRIKELTEALNICYSAASEIDRYNDAKLKDSTIELNTIKIKAAVMKAGI